MPLLQNSHVCVFPGGRRVEHKFRTVCVRGGGGGGVLDRLQELQVVWLCVCGVCVCVCVWGGGRKGGREKDARACALE